MNIKVLKGPTGGFFVEKLIYLVVINSMLKLELRSLHFVGFSNT